MSTTSGALEETAAVAHRAVIIRGVEVDYEARAESIVLHDEDGTPACSVFSVTYTRRGVESARRPVVYAFDGGPGTASMTLHLGLLGPRRVALGSGAFAARVPAPLVDNPFSLLDVADIVVVDPVGTGFSRTAAEQDPRRFCGYTQDLESVAQFIVEHLGRIGRWDSPVVVLGESYGGMRACGLSFLLEDRFGLYPAGVALVVPAVSSQALSFSPGNDLPHVLYLPTMAAVARYHGRAGVGVDEAAWLAEVETFAVDEYAPALLRGGALATGRRREVAARLAAYTGLDATFVEAANLRVSDQRFYKELLRGERRILSRADPRVTGVDRDAAGEEPEHDPYTAYIRRVFTAAANAYLRTEIGYETPLHYRGYDKRVLPWHYADVAANRFLFAAESLRLAMAKHPGMQVLVASGVYDGSVPYFSVENTLDRAIQEPELADNVTMRRYSTGHLLYLEEPAATEVASDLAAFVRRAAGVPSHG